MFFCHIIWAWNIAYEIFSDLSNLDLKFHKNRTSHFGGVWLETVETLRHGNVTYILEDNKMLTYFK